MSIRRSATGLAGVLPALFLTVGCGHKQTVASKSAASYDEAQRKGIAVGQGHGHGHSPEPQPKPEPASAVAAPGDPAATLRADRIDAPAPTAVADAERSSALAAEMATGGHHMHHGTYVQTDAGRASPTPTPSPRTEERR